MYLRNSRVTFVGYALVSDVTHVTGLESGCLCRSSLTVTDLEVIWAVLITSAPRNCRRDSAKLSLPAVPSAASSSSFLSLA